MSPTPVLHGAVESLQNNGQPATKPKSRRGGARRQPVSCLSCRHHKLRCDRRIPCGTCSQYGREDQCIRNPAPAPARIKNGPYGQRPTVRPREQALRTEVSLTPNSSGLVPENSVFESSNANQQDNPRRFSTAQQKSQAELDNLTNQVRLIGALDIGPLPTGSLKEVLASSYYSGQGGSLWRNAFDTEYRRGRWAQQLAAVLGTRAQCDMLLNFYVEHINWIFQTVHVPSFRRDYARFWDEPMEKVDFIWLSLLFSITSLSALYIPHEAAAVVGLPKNAIRALAHTWHLASQQALRAGDYEAKPCLIQLQTFSITQLYWYANNRIETLNSRLGQAVRVAQALHLDKDTSASECLQDELRHRLWWDLVDSDMFQCICLGRPPLIRLQTPGVPLPLNANDDDLKASHVRYKPMSEPTEMSMNIFRANVFRVLNRRYFADKLGQEHPSYEDVLETDAELIKLVDQLPWYFQTDDRGHPARLHSQLGEVLAWQHHILRTLISTQRIRMYRPFLSSQVSGAWGNCVKAAADALLVYRTLREDCTESFRLKFLPQAYQVFSVAVSIAALLLVEQKQSMPNMTDQLKNMIEDLKLLELQGTLAPIATQGRNILLKMLSLCEVRALGSTSPEEVQSLVPEIAIILGGERTTRAYMNTVATDNGAMTGRVEKDRMEDQLNMNPAARDQIDEGQIVWSQEAEMDSSGTSGFLDTAWQDLDLDYNVSNWDMTGLLLDFQTH